MALVNILLNFSLSVGINKNIFVLTDKLKIIMCFFFFKQYFHLSVCINENIIRSDRRFPVHLYESLATAD